MAGIDWDMLWSMEAPALNHKDVGTSPTDEIDWRLSSLALSQPLRYEYDSNCKLDST